MTIDSKIKGEKLQYNIKGEAAKYQPFHQAKLIQICEYLTGEEILLSGPSQIIQQAKFTYSPLGKAAENRTKTIELQTKIIKDQKDKQANAFIQLTLIKDQENDKEDLLLKKQKEYLVKFKRKGLLK